MLFNYLFKKPISLVNNDLNYLGLSEKTSGSRHQLASIDYELSSDLKNKEIEILYRKYGGHLRCKRAARVIQLAYREYRLRKNYFKLCESNLKRRSFDTTEPIVIVDDQGNEKKFLTNGSIVQMRQPRLLKNNETACSIDKADENKFSMDLPSVDFDRLVEQFNNHNDNSGKF